MTRIVPVLVVAFAILGLSISRASVAAGRTSAASVATRATPAASNCRTVRYRVHGKRWVWRKKTRRVHGQRRVVRVHGRIVWVHRHVRYTRVQHRRVCPSRTGPAAKVAPVGSGATPPAAKVAPVGSGATATNCFSSPGACGYPDPTVGNVGVPSGVTLSPSGSLTIRSPGTYSNLDVRGTVTISASNVTLQDSRVTAQVGDGCSGLGCGAADIVVLGSNVHINHVELTAVAGASLPEGVRNQGDRTNTATAIWSHGPDMAWWGEGTITDSYFLAAQNQTGDHVENVYAHAGDHIDIEHTVLLNPIDQTANVFDNGLSSEKNGPADVTIRNSLLAGGGWNVYPDANESPTGQATITGNRFARCLTPTVSGTDGEHLCRGGADAHGYFPDSGSYSTHAYDAATMTWTGNYWDDNLAPVN